MTIKHIEGYKDIRQPVYYFPSQTKAHHFIGEMTCVFIATVGIALAYLLF